jgi:CubicO group peptidase (beta-lactamase class C family)
MDRYLEAAQHFGFSGAVLVADREGIVLRKGYGPADATRRISPEMLFDMGSITKQFTAAAILLLESEGRLATTDSLAKFFPDAPPDKRGITLHQLLTHTSGIISDFADDYAQVSRDSAVRAIFNSPLQAPPGREFNYSNAGFSLLAMLIEQFSGQTYDRFMEERVFRPAGMRHTGYVIANLDSALVAHSYTPPVDHGTPAQRLQRAGGPGWNLKGNGGLLTTVDDLYSYDRALEAGRPISKAIQAKQFAEQFRRSPTLAHGYDWWIEAAGDDGIQYNRAGDGPPTGVSGEYRKYPRDSTVFIMLANNRHHGGSTRRYIMPNLRRLFLGTMAFEPPLVRGAAAAELDAVTGIYAVDSNSYFRVERSGDHLSLSAIGQPAVNVLVFNRDSNSVRGRERLNERATNLIRALATGDTAALRATLGPDANIAKTLAWWSGLASRLGGFQRLRVLGTGRLDRGLFTTTVRACFHDSSKTLRWAWTGGTPVLSSEDVYLPGAFEFGAESPVEAAEWSPYWWMPGRDSLVTYDMAFNSVLSAGIARRPDGTPSELVFKVPTGEVRARRTGGAARRPSGPPRSSCSAGSAPPWS